jgi:hypothetical protein
MRQTPRRPREMQSSPDRLALRLSKVDSDGSVVALGPLESDGRGRGEIGKHAGFRCQCSKELGGSSPSARIAESRRAAARHDPAPAVVSRFGTWSTETVGAVPRFGLGPPSRPNRHHSPARRRGVDEVRRQRFAFDRVRAAFFAELLRFLAFFARVLAAFSAAFFRFCGPWLIRS